MLLTEVGRVLFGQYTPPAVSASHPCSLPFATASHSHQRPLLLGGPRCVPLRRESVMPFERSFGQSILLPRPCLPTLTPLLPVRPTPSSSNGLLLRQRSIPTVFPPPTPLCTQLIFRLILTFQPHCQHAKHGPAGARQGRRRGRHGGTIGRGWTLQVMTLLLIQSSRDRIPPVGFDVSSRQASASILLPGNARTVGVEGLGGGGSAGILGVIHLS